MRTFIVLPKGTIRTMTGATQANELSQSIRVRLQTYFDTVVRPGEISEFELKLLRRDIDRLRKVDRISANRLECALETWLLNYDRCLELVANIRANGGADHANLVAFFVEANFLYATKALELVGGVFENPLDRPFHEIISQAVAIGAFTEVVSAIDRANQEGLVFTPTKLVQTARQAREVLATLGINDAQVARCVDVAGEVLREHKLLWLGSHPDAWVVPASTPNPAVSFGYKVPVSAREASAMSWLLAEKIVERGLDFPGLSLSFVGVAESEEAVESVAA